MLVSNIQRFCVNDGNGIRTTIFFKGCLLSCVWCHNPETKSFSKQLLFYPSKCLNCHRCESVCLNKVHTFTPLHQLNRTLCMTCKKCQEICPTNALQINGQEYSIAELVNIVLKDEAFYEKTGGVTLSGGEPLCQKEIVLLIDALKEKHLNIAIETCGYFNTEILNKIVSKVDLFLFDFKDSNPQRHLKNTGVDQQLILNNLKRIDELHGKTRLRCLLIDGINCELSHYENIVKTVKQLKHCEGVELIPYHAYGGTKATFLGLKDNGHEEWIPSQIQINEVKMFLKRKGIKVI